jgi:hypothetical protein
VHIIKKGSPCVFSKQQSFATHVLDSGHFVPNKSWRPEQSHGGSPDDMSG